MESAVRVAKVKKVNKESINAEGGKTTRKGLNEQLQTRIKTVFFPPELFQ